MMCNIYIVTDTIQENVTPIAAVEPIRINLERVLQQNEELRHENTLLKQQLANMSQRIQRLMSGEVERMESSDVEFKMNNQVNYCFSLLLIYFYTGMFRLQAFSHTYMPTGNGNKF